MFTVDQIKNDFKKLCCETYESFISENGPSVAKNKIKEIAQCELFQKQHLSLTNEKDICKKILFFHGTIAGNNADDSEWLVSKFSQYESEKQREGEQSNENYGTYFEHINDILNYMIIKKPDEIKVKTYATVHPIVEEVCSYIYDSMQTIRINDINYKFNESKNHMFFGLPVLENKHSLPHDMEKETIWNDDVVVALYYFVYKIKREVGEFLDVSQENEEKIKTLIKQLLSTIAGIGFKKIVGSILSTIILKVIISNSTKPKLLNIISFENYTLFFLNALKDDDYQEESTGQVNNTTDNLTDFVYLMAYGLVKCIRSTDAQIEFNRILCDAPKYLDNSAVEALKNCKINLNDYNTENVKQSIKNEIFQYMSKDQNLMCALLFGNFDFRDVDFKNKFIDQHFGQFDKKEDAFNKLKNIEHKGKNVKVTPGSFLGLGWDLLEFKQ